MDAMDVMVVMDVVGGTDVMDVIVGYGYGYRYRYRYGDRYGDGCNYG